MTSVEIAEHIDALERDGVLLADAAARAGLTAAVPSCTGWQVRDLVRHQAYVHSWAARHVREQLPDLIDGASEDEVLRGGPPDDELIASYREGHAALVKTLRCAGPDVTCATFMPAPSPLAFWARRQAHETAIHRYDAQSAVPGGPSAPVIAFDAAFADDGIDELVMGFAARRRYRLRGADDTGARCLVIRPADTGGRWHVRLDSGATAVQRGDTPDADCVLGGPAAGLYAFLWNRCSAAEGAVTITGDPAILDLWSSNVRVAW